MQPTLVEGDTVSVAIRHIDEEYAGGRARGENCASDHVREEVVFFQKKERKFYVYFRDN